jgi:Carboxypeptidase regulatory-like domain
MFKGRGFFFLLVASFYWLTLPLTPSAQAQQTLGGITGTVTDKSSGALTGTTVTIVSEQTKLSRTQKTNESGSYDFVNLPIGTYRVTFTREGFQTQTVPSVLVQANRTATINATLELGAVTSTITVNENPLLNAVDTTNGYALDEAQVESIPLPTGSFTGLAVLSPGVSAELSSGTGANSGLGNQPVWANGQRDTSNSFLLNGVDASNLFNGKSTSQVNSARVVNGTNGGLANNPGVIQSSASVYLAIGQALPTPAPESIQEVQVNTSMYDAQQGSTSGAHIDVSTISGTNSFHGSAYLHRGTDWLNAAPLFFKLDPHIPASQKVPELHREVPGGTFGGPIIKDKLFGFIAYQHAHVSDQEIGISRLTVPLGLTDTNRTAQGLADLANTNFATPTGQTPLTASQISPVALALFQYKLPNGQFLIPSANGPTPTAAFPDNAVVPGTAYFLSNQAVANLDWNASSKDVVSVKYYFQDDPSTAPYAFSNVAGFSENTDAGSQVVSITNTQQLKPNLNIVETFGFIREKIYITNQQPFTSSQLGINSFGSSYFPGISITDIVGNSSPNNPGVFNQTLNIGAGPTSQGAFTGVFQNRFNPSVNATWMVGKHTLSFGGNYAYTQLNTRDERTNKGMVASVDLYEFVQGLVSPYENFVATAYLKGDANRYYRANQAGPYIQDKYQIRPNLTVTVGLRWDWNAGLAEKRGRIFNFDPTQYAFDQTTGVVTSNGLIVAGNNNQAATPGVSNTTLTGRQWGFAPRLGIAWSPSSFHSKVVVRAGAGLYYDRGELFSYLSPAYAVGLVDSGPFGVNQAPPFVMSQVCTALTAKYQGFFNTCDPNLPTGGSLSAPWGTVPPPTPTGNPADISKFLPTASQIAQGAPLFSLGVYDRRNKLPYTINDIFDIQWQPRSDLAIDIGYVGNLGRHEVIPVPFNQPGIATPTNPIHGQQYTYGYQVSGPAGCQATNSCASLSLPNGQGPYLATYEGGNTDLRVPYVGYSAESISYEAAGISAYNALQAHVQKRVSHGLQAGFSYTYSHSLDEQSALGLVYNGNNPLNLRSGYGSSDFDRTHIFNFNYVYEFPKPFQESSLRGKLADGWVIEGIAVFQSGQPFSVVDFSGAVGSIYYSVNDNITNPIAPLSPNCTPQQAYTGFNGVNGPALNANCFTVPSLSPGALNGAIPANDPYETTFTSGQRNIFRQGWQKRTDLSIVKLTKFSERISVRYSLDIFDLTNTASLDVPMNFIFQNSTFNGAPVAGTPTIGASGSGSFYQPGSGLGIVHNTIGSMRQIQMSLQASF